MYQGYFYSRANHRYRHHGPGDTLYREKDQGILMMLS